MFKRKRLTTSPLKAPCRHLRDTEVFSLTDEALLVSQAFDQCSFETDSNPINYKKKKACRIALSSTSTLR